MNKQVDLHIKKYPAEIEEMFLEIRQIIWDNVSGEIEAKSVGEHREELTDYKFTSKGMMQVFIKQDIPVSILRKIFVETFAG